MKKAWAIVALAAVIQEVQAAELRATVMDEQGKPVTDAVVVALPETVVPRAPRSQLDQVEQINLEFVPYVKAIQLGTSVSFPNRDGVRHHVYSFSPAKRFELPLYVGTPAQPVIFDKPGVVTIGCNIHDWMIGYIYVTESPYFAATAADGGAVIASLPPGRYAARVWHPRLAVAEEKTVQATDLGAALEWRIPLKPETRVRRAPSSGRGSRY
jgi:plastocyanin